MSDSTPSTATSTTPMSPPCCAASNTSRSRTAVRLPVADPAPIGRVLDAGADAVIVAMIESAEQAAAAVAATRYPPAGVRSFGPLRAGLGHDTGRAGIAGQRVRDDRDRRGASADVDDICAVAGSYRNLRRAGRSGDLDGRRGHQGASHPAVLDAVTRIQRAARAAGLVTGIHASDGKVGNAMAQLGFQMITLASESQALRRGAAAGLEEATAQDAPTGSSPAGGYQ